MKQFKQGSYVEGQEIGGGEETLRESESPARCGKRREAQEEW